MRLLIILTFLFLGLIPAKSQSPHGQKFDLDCSICHTDENWVVERSKMTFNHSKTGFILEGEHANVQCRSCHQSLVFSEAKTECFNCHQDMHNQTVGFDCIRCHTPKTWIIENTRNIHLQSRFPLLGTHSVADCSSCHPSASKLQFNSLGIDCYNCHKAKYLATTNPNHLQVGYSTNCTECHSEKSYEWIATGLNHAFFPLTKGHAINCVLCHKNGKFEKISAVCSDCHLVNYNSTTTPNHVQLGFSINCADCHTTDPKWQPAKFVQHDALFPLTGVHAIDCNLCHKNGNFGKISANCIDCHLANYNATTNPNHVQSGFSTNCTDCHTTDPGWKPASYKQHDSQYFPIYSGRHKGRWSNCTDCHPGTSTYASFSCLLNCHAKSSTDNGHRDVGGYSYQSNACYSCHSRGVTGD